MRRFLRRMAPDLIRGRVLVLALVAVLGGSAGAQWLPQTITPTLAPMASGLVGLAGASRQTLSTGETSGYPWTWNALYLTSGSIFTLKCDDDTLTSGYYIRCLGGTSYNTRVFSIGEGGATSIIPTAAAAAVDALAIDGTVLTSGDAIQLKAVDATLNGGKYLNCLGGTGSTAVFTLAEDGVTAISSTVATSNSLSITNNAAMTGDLVILTADDDLLESGGYYLRCLGGTNHATEVFSVAEGGAQLITPSTAAAAVDALAIDGTVTTSGDLVELKAVDTTLNGGKYLNCLGGAGSTAVFTVAEDGVTAITSTGVTSNSLTITNNTATTGDLLTLTADDDPLTTAGYYVNCLGGSNHATQVFAIAEQGVLEVYKQNILVNTDGTETLTVGQSGVWVSCTKSDGATAITIPDPSADSIGVIYTILQTVDQNVTVGPTTGNGNSIIADNVLTSDLVTLGTASHKIGAGVRIVGVSATKWHATALSGVCPLTVEAAD